MVATTDADYQGMRAAGHVGCCLNVVGAAVQKVADKMVYQIVENLGSHGVGHSNHEEPSFTTGLPWVEEQQDGWTLSVAPGELVTQFEQTVIVGARGA